MRIGEGEYEIASASCYSVLSLKRVHATADKRTDSTHSILTLCEVGVRVPGHSPSEEAAPYVSAWR